MGSLRRPIWLYMVLALVLTWPMATAPMSVVSGHEEASVGCHIWVIWWARNHLDTLDTDLIFHPYGADVIQLYGSDIFSPLVLGAIPLPPVLLYNFWVVFLLVLGAVGMQKLATLGGATTSGAVLGGVLFESAPFFRHELLNGTTEMLAAAILPWFCWCLFRVLDHPSRRSGLWLGIVISVGVAMSAYNLFFMGLMGVVILLYRSSTRMEPVLSRSVRSAFGWGVLVTSPVAVVLGWLHSRHGAAEIYSRRTQLSDSEVVLPDSYASLESWLSPRPIELPFMMGLPNGGSLEYWTTCTVFLGLFASSLTIYAVCSRRRLGALGVAAVVAGLIAMGPWLRVGGEVMSLAGREIALPSLVLADLLPPFRITALHAYRYAVVVVLGVAFLVSTSWRWRNPIAWGVGTLVLVESLWLSPVPWPARTTSVPESETLNLLAESAPGAVLHLPMRTDDLGELGRMLMAQTIHGHPVHDGGIHRRAGEDSTLLFEELPALNRLSDPSNRRIPDPRQSAWALRELHGLGYRYVLVDTTDTEGRYWANDNLGSPLFSDDSWMLWSIEPGSLEP